MTIRYHDVSHFNGAYQPTGPTVAKATEGSTFTDSEFAAIRSRTRAGGWPFLAYHFLAHGNIAAQVAHVVSVVGRGQPVMLDVESEPGTPDPTLADILAFADQYAAAGGRVTLGYLPRWYWSGHLGSPSLVGLRTRHIGLVSSLFTTYSDSGPGWAPYGGLTPVIWQYTSTPLDTNAFKGTQAQLATLWANGTNNPPEVDMPLTQADADLVASTLLGRLLGNSGPVVAVALQSTFQRVTAIQAALDPDALAAAIAAKLGGSADVATIKIALSEWFAAAAAAANPSSSTAPTGPTGPTAPADATSVASPTATAAADPDGKAAAASPE